MVTRVQCILMPRAVSGVSVSMEGLGHQIQTGQRYLAVMAEAVGLLTHLTRQVATAAMAEAVHQGQVQVLEGGAVLVVAVVLVIVAAATEAKASPT